MRYYEITLSGASTTPGAPAADVLSWTSFPNGIIDPNALLVEFDFFSAQQQDYPGSSTLTIYGLSLDTLQQANSGAYTGMTLTMKAGMQRGLPLTNPAQAGTILNGPIYQSFGNWVTTDMTLDFVVNYAGPTYQTPGNFVLNWPKQTSLKASLATALNLAYPTLGSPQLLIGDEYVLAHDVYHACHTFRQFAQFVSSITAKIKPPGVTLSLISPQNYVRAYDGSIAVGATIPIAFTDLVGQPTWIAQGVMQFTTVMRGDIQVNSIIKMPQGLPQSAGTVILTGSSLPSSLKYQTAFQGNFTITGIRYVGNSRDPSGQSWVSIFRCVPGPNNPLSATLPST